MDLHIKQDDDRFATLITTSDKRHAENTQVLAEIQKSIEPATLAPVIRESIAASRRKSIRNAGLVAVSTLVALGGMFPLLQWVAGFTIAWVQVQPAIRAEASQPPIPSHPFTPPAGVAAPAPLRGPNPDN